MSRAWRSGTVQHHHACVILAWWIFHTYHTHNKHYIFRTHQQVRRFVFCNTTAARHAGALFRCSRSCQGSVTYFGFYAVLVLIGVSLSVTPDPGCHLVHYPSVYLSVWLSVHLLFSTLSPFYHVSVCLGNVVFPVLHPQLLLEPPALPFRCSRSSPWPSSGSQFAEKCCFIQKIYRKPHQNRNAADLGCIEALMLFLIRNCLLTLSVVSVTRQPMEFSCWYFCLLFTSLVKTKSANF